MENPVPHNVDFTILLRLVVGALLGFTVGFERWCRGSYAGDRTFALVALGAAAFTAVGIERFPETAEKVLAGIVTGIGFLGAGLIMRSDDGAIRGLTTAAALWSTAAVGILAGIGEYTVATLTAFFIIFILELEYVPLVNRLLLKARRVINRSEEDEKE